MPIERAGERPAAIRLPLVSGGASETTVGATVRPASGPTVDEGGGWPGGLLWRGLRGGWWSAGRGGERLELLERGLQCVGPWPGCGEVQLAAPSGEREPCGDVQEPVTQALGLGFGELSVEHERLGPDEQLVREHHDLQPHFVERERLERELRQAGVLVVADAVLDPGALTVTSLQHGDLRVWSVRIAWKRYPS